MAGKFASRMAQFFKFGEVSPLMEQMLLAQTLSAPILFLQKKYAEEELYRMDQAMREEAEEGAREERTEAVSEGPEVKGGEHKETAATHFTLLYYNPELKKTEVIQEDVSLKYSDYSGPEQQAVEESVSQKSTYPVYSLVTSPLMRTKVNPYILEAVLSRIEVVSPSPFGGGAPVPLASQEAKAAMQEIADDGSAAEIVAVEAIRELADRKAAVEKELDREIIALEEAVQALQETDKPEKKIMEKLPPLSRARFQALMRSRKKVERTLLADLLLLDAEFLVTFRKNLAKTGLRKLADILKKFRKMPAKKKK